MKFSIQHVHTSPYYPNPSLSERVNRNLKIAMRIYHHMDHRTWDQNIHWFQIAYNSARHDSTGHSPASLFLGREITHPLELAWNLKDLVPDNPHISTEEKWQEAIQNLSKARQKRERIYNKDRKPNPYQPGDWVMYRLHPQSKAIDNINSKLMPLWSKPCIIECFTSPVTVRLVNPSTAKYVQTAHVSQLKRFLCRI